MKSSSVEMYARARNRVEDDSSLHQGVKKLMGVQTKCKDLNEVGLKSGSDKHLGIL